MPTIGELNERIGELQIELVDAEDRWHSEKRSNAIRAEIAILKAERDLLPPPRRSSE